MSDLISRSALIETLEKYKFGAISNEAEREYIKDTVIGFVSEQPNAYDIDAIVEQLKCATFFTSQNVESIYIGRAIDIVRGGGSRK